MDERAVRDQLLALLRGGQAYITAEDALDRVPLERVNETPKGFPHSAWQLLEHLRICQWDILEYIRNPGHESPSWPEGYWPDPNDEATPARWKGAVKQFKSELTDLKRLVDDSRVDLTAPMPHTPGHSVLREILIVADHNAYHLGQLVQLCRVLDVW